MTGTGTGTQTQTQTQTQTWTTGVNTIALLVLRTGELKRSEKDLFFMTFLIKAYVVGAHLNCIDKSMQFK